MRFFRRMAGVAEQRSCGRLDRGERRAKFVRDRVEQNGAKLFAFARGFGAAQLLERTGSLNGNGDQTADCFESLAGKARARNTHAADDADSDAQRHEGWLADAVAARLAA